MRGWALLSIMLCACGAKFETAPADGGGMSAGGSGGEADGGAGEDGGGGDPSCDNFALEFDGVDDHVSIPVGGTLTGSEFTAEVWVRPTGEVGQREMRLWSYATHTPGTGYMAAIQDPSGEAQARVYTPTSTSLNGAVVPADQWMHIAVTYSNGTMRIYQNGAFHGERQGLQITPYTGAFSLGSSNGNHHLEGRLDEMRLSTGVRYSGGQFTPERRLADDDQTWHLWTFDEGSGSTVADSKGPLAGQLNGNSGDSNGPQFVPAPCE